MSALVAHSSLDPPPLEVTFSKIMCSDVGGSRMARRAVLGVIFPCSPAGPWISCVRLHFSVNHVSGLWQRQVRRKDRSVHLGFYGVRKSQNQLQSEILLFLSNYTIESIFSGVSPPPHPSNWKFSSP